jgi:hypothetical protein
MSKKESPAVVAKLSISVYENDEVSVEVNVEDGHLMMAGIATAMMDENHPEIAHWFKTAVVVAGINKTALEDDIKKLSKKKKKK